MLVFPWITTGTVNVALAGGLCAFLGVVSVISLASSSLLFLDSHGWRHRLAGALELVWLMVGAVSTLQRELYATTDDNTDDDAVAHQVWVLWYDIVLGVLGVTATVTAARDFPHKYIRNAVGQSGSLSQKAMVTQAEMMEHVFYQGLNIVQALYLHAFFTTSSSSSSRTVRFLGLVLVTLPWWIRRQFPVHSFSANWQQTPIHQRTVMETWLYRIKKLQYLFYKHVIFHGLNLSVFLQAPLEHHHDNATTTTTMSSPSATTTTTAWRVFWLSLNTSYVMEFFLQSLVRRSVLRQGTMLWLNRYLMLVASISAVSAVLSVVRWDLCLGSLLLNFWHRYHDVTNTLILAVGAWVWAVLNQAHL